MLRLRLEGEAARAEEDGPVIAMGTATTTAITGR